MKSASKVSGFTLIELLMVVVIGGLVVTLVAFSFARLNEKEALDQSADLAVAVLNEAKALTLASVEGERYGVQFEPDRLILFQGSIYSANDPDNVSTLFHSLVGARNINLAGGGSAVVFKRLTGATDEPGELELYLKNATEIFRTVIINSAGTAYEE